MSDDLKDIWTQIVKYSSVANGTALTLALSTIGKSPIIQLSASIGKFPIWCFFLGLLASGLHLIINFVYIFERTRVEGRKAIDKLVGQINEARAEAVASGAISPELSKSVARLEKLKSSVSEFDFGQKENIIEHLRGAQELFLWTSYALFFVGVFVVVWSV